MKWLVHAGRAATSEIRAKTFSGGAEMWVRTVTESTAAILRSERSPGGRETFALFARRALRRYTGRPPRREERDADRRVRDTGGRRHVPLPGVLVPCRSARARRGPSLSPLRLARVQAGLDLRRALDPRRRRLPGGRSPRLARRGARGARRARRLPRLRGRRARPRGAAPGGLHPHRPQPRRPRPLR